MSRRKKILAEAAAREKLLKTKAGKRRKLLLSAVALAVVTVGCPAFLRWPSGSIAKGSVQQSRSFDTNKSPTTTLADFLGMSETEICNADIAEIYTATRQGQPNYGSIDRERLWSDLEKTVRLGGSESSLHGAQLKVSRLLAAVNSHRNSDVPLGIQFLSAGRRLGYPLKLVASGRGLSLDWQDEQCFPVLNEPFRFDGGQMIGEQGAFTGPSQEAPDGGGTLSRTDEFAVLLDMRGQRFAEEGKNADALVSFSQANAVTSSKFVPVLAHIKETTAIIAGGRIRNMEMQEFSRNRPLQ